MTKPLKPASAANEASAAPAAKNAAETKIKPLKAILLSRMLNTDRILFVKDTPAKQDIIVRLVDCIGAAYKGIKTQAALKKVMEREQGASTILDTGLCIPHARMEDIDDFAMALAVIPEGIADNSQPGVTIKAIFLFLSPNNPQFFQKHLKLLSALSSLFQPAFIDRLIKSQTPQEVIDIISSAE